MKIAVFTYGFRGLVSYFNTCSWRRNLVGGIALDGYEGGGGKHIFKVPLQVELCVYFKKQYF